MIHKNKIIFVKLLITFINIINIILFGLCQAKIFYSKKLQTIYDNSHFYPINTLSFNIQMVVLLSSIFTLLLLLKPQWKIMHICLIRVSTALALFNIIFYWLLRLSNRHLVLFTDQIRSFESFMEYFNNLYGYFILFFNYAMIKEIVDVKYAGNRYKNMSIIFLFSLYYLSIMLVCYSLTGFLPYPFMSHMNGYGAIILVYLLLLFVSLGFIELLNLISDDKITNKEIYSKNDQN